MKLTNHHYSERNFFNSEIDKTNLDVTSALPEEVALKIFSLLNLAELKTNCYVSKEWKLLSSNPDLWKNVIYKELAFSNDKWAQYFGENVVKDEDRQEEFASLPLNIVEYYQKFQSKFPGKKAKDSLMLVRLPKTLNGKLSLNSLGELLKKYFPKNSKGFSQGYRYFMHAIANLLGDKSIDASFWALMTIESIPDSENLSYDEQQKLVQDKLIIYEIPGALEAVTCILAKYLDSQTRLFKDDPWTFIRCAENIQDSQILVGGFSPYGLRIQILLGDTSGVAAILKFKPLSK